MKEKPLISIIIPTFNGGKQIPKCLNSISTQRYPKNKTEVIVVDDGSTDNTLEIAKKHKAKIFYSGKRHVESSKSFGLEKAKGKFIFFIDQDNSLTSKKWFATCIDIFDNNKDVVGIESWRVKHKKNDTLINRYCALFGVTDPLVFYLGRKGWLMHGENWRDSKFLIKDEPLFYIQKFDTTNLPTIGSNGYMIKKNLLKKTNWKPYLFHLDSTYDLVKNGYNVFARIKLDVEHDYAKSVRSAIKKIKRNTYLYVKYEKIRRYKYNISTLRLLKTIVVMVTFIIPLYDSIRGYIKVKDRAWFLNPILCFVYVWVYTFYTIKFRVFESVQ